MTGKLEKVLSQDGTGVVSLEVSWESSKMSRVKTGLTWRVLKFLGKLKKILSQDGTGVESLEVS